MTLTLLSPLLSLEKHSRSAPRHSTLVPNLLVQALALVALVILTRQIIPVRSPFFLCR